ncbi:MAG: SRPBCC family protein [Patulibacter sp.]|nr:SRPBCC family protein [Patulibacter sp.]
MSTAASSESLITTTWPEGFDARNPAIAGFAVREVAAPAESVFAWIRRPDLHTEYYKGLRGVRKAGGAWPQLEVGSKVSFFLGALFVPPVKVVQCDPVGFHFAWAGGGPGIDAVHAFTVVATSDTTSLLRSEEVWQGPVSKLIKPVAAGTLQKVQTDWAAAIAAAASQHPLGPPAA